MRWFCRGGWLVGVMACSFAPSPMDSATQRTGQIVFSEVMYHTVGEDDYVDHYEFLEIHNAGDAAVDLSGWQLSDGVRYTFGAVQMAPGQTVVVAGDREALLSLYPELDPALVVGNWEGALSNGGEDVRLETADGTVVESFRYDDEAPWPIGADALGVQRDWLPASVLPLEDHFGKGRSLQRVSFAAPVDEPGSWKASPLDGPDPGVVDSVDGTAALAVVSSLTWGDGGSDALAPDAPVVLTATVQNGPVAGFHVEWFADDLSTDAEDIQQVNFVDDGRGEDAVAGDGQWTAVLPPQPEGTILRASMWADDGTQSWRISPRDGDPFDWHGRFVGSPISGETRPYQIWIDPDQWTAMWDQIEDNRVIDCDPNPGWTARVPAVFVFEGDVFDVWVRYQGSRWNRTNGREMTWEVDGPERPSPLRALSWSVKFPRYAPLDGQTRISLNKLTQSCPGVTTTVGFRLFEAVGLPVPLTRYARLFVNGAYYNYVLEIESPGEDMLERWLDARSTADSEGFSETEVPHLFKSSGCYCDEGPYGWGDERPLVESCGWSAAERYAATYKRKTWDWAGHEDLQALLEGLDAARGSDDDTLRAFIDAHFVVEDVLAYMAVMNWAVPYDDMFQNHFLVQRRSDGRWFVAPWDLDQNFGGWKWADASIYMGEENDPDNRSGWWNRIKDAFFQVYRSEYEQTLFAFNETVLHPDVVHAWVDEAEAAWSLSEAQGTPAGPECDFSAGASTMRSFASDRHAVVSALADQ